MLALKPLPYELRAYLATNAQITFAVLTHTERMRENPIVQRSEVLIYIHSIPSIYLLWNIVAKKADQFRCGGIDSNSARQTKLSDRETRHS